MELEVLEVCLMDPPAAAELWFGYASLLNIELKYLFFLCSDSYLPYLTSNMTRIRLVPTVVNKR